MKKTVEFPIGVDTIIRITRYSGTGRVNVNLITKDWGYNCIYRFACSVGDLSEDVQAELERFGLGKIRNRRTKSKISQSWKTKKLDMLSTAAPLSQLRRCLNDE